jgi:hypothetical protein
MSTGQKFADLYSFPTKPFVHNISDDEVEEDCKKRTPFNCDDDVLSDVSESNLDIFSRNPKKKRIRKPAKYKSQKNQKIVVLDDSSGDDRKPIEIGSDDEVWILLNVHL